MSFFISSLDAIASNPFNSRYNLPRQVKGSYRISYQYLGANTASLINWCNSTNNQMKVYPTFNPFLDPFDITFANMSTSDSTEIVTWLQNGWLQAAAEWPSLNPVTTYNSANDTYHTITDVNVGVITFLPSELEDPTQGSTCATIMNWSPNGSGALFEPPTNEFIVSGVNFGLPTSNVLEVKCPQVRNELVHTTSTFNNQASFLISTSGNAIPYQFVTFLQPVNYIDLTFYKPGSASVVNYDSNFLMYFHKI